MGNQARNAETEIMIEGLADMVINAAIKFGIEPTNAAMIADDVIDLFFAEYGGRSSVYVPVGRTFRASRRHREIWDAFTGNNQRELAKRFGLVEPYIYEVLKKERIRDRAERQSQIPGL